MRVIKQYLKFPFPTTMLEAGWMSEKYKKYWGYDHLGFDLTSYKRETKDIIFSSGYGKVLAVGKDSRVGNVIVIQYFNIFNSRTQKIGDVIARYMHLDSIYVTAGQDVALDTKLGVMGDTSSSTKPMGIHLHLEFDYDLKYPLYSAQVKGGTIIKKGTDVSTMIPPSHVLFSSRERAFKVYTNSWYSKDDITIYKAQNAVTNATGTNETVSVTPDTSSTDAPTQGNSDASVPTSQKLIMPINSAKITATMKTDAYYQNYGFKHYGTDMTSSVGDRTVWASGNGTVLEAGYDSLFGYTAIVKYPNAYNHRTKETKDVILRYFHGKSLICKKGDAVTKDSKLMLYGGTGTYGGGDANAHLHITADYDIEYYNYEPGIKTSGTLIKKGNDSTVISVLALLHIKTSSPDNQKVVYSSNTYKGNKYVLDLEQDQPSIT